MRRLDVLIVDDEPPACRRLERLLSELDGVERVRSAGSGDQAQAVCREQVPDVVLLDVEMPGPDGLEVAEALAGLDQPPGIIFVTAFENYAVDAFRVRALDYLVKPVRAGRLAEALERARADGPAAPEPPPRLLARVGDRTVVIPLADIRLLQAEDKYTTVHYPGGTALLDDSLVSLEQNHPELLYRVHRNALVSANHVQELFRDGNGRYCVRIADCPVTPEVSRRNLARLRKLLAGPSGAP